MRPIRGLSWLAGDVFLHGIEAQARLDRELPGQSVLVLDIDAADHTGLALRVVDAERRVDRVAGGVCRQHRRIVDCLRTLDIAGEPEPHRLALVETQGGIALQTVDEARPRDVRGDAVEDEIADRVGHEMQGAVALEVGDLTIERTDRLLQRKHVEDRALDLVLVQQRRVEVGRAEGRELRRKAGRIRDLVLRDGRAGQEREPRAIVERGRGVGEVAALPRPIMDRVVGGGGVLDPKLVGDEATGEEIVPASRNARGLDRRNDRARGCRHRGSRCCRDCRRRCAR